MYYEEKPHEGSKAANLITLELMWRELLPEFDLPAEYYLRSWLNRGTVEQIISAMEETRHRAAKGKLQSAEHAAAFTASRLNVLVDRKNGTRYAPDHSRALHFNEDGR